MPEAAVGLRERNKREKLERITASARELFRSKGFDETTAREICERARIGTGTLFLYVRDKRELLFLCFEADARRLFAEGRAEAVRTVGLVPQLMCLFRRFIGVLRRRPRALEGDRSRALLPTARTRRHRPAHAGVFGSRRGTRARRTEALRDPQRRRARSCRDGLLRALRVLDSRLARQRDASSRERGTGPSAGARAPARGTRHRPPRRNAQERREEQIGISGSRPVRRSIGRAG